MTGCALLAGRYEVRGVLGRGGMAEVRDGWDTRLKRPVAIKLLHSTVSAAPEIQRRFEDEARLAAALSHPNIVTVHDVGEHEGAAFIVMERLPGYSLADQIEQGPLPPSQVRSILVDVLAALEAAHAGGLLHRDIKPGNILFSTTGDSVKVADFGIAKSVDSSHTVTGQIVGTMAFLSPQRVAGAPACVGDDLYAVGLTAYEALTGQPPFQQDNPAALARAIIDEPPPSLAQVRPDIDPELTDAIDRAIGSGARPRFASAAEMRAALAGGYGAAGFAAAAMAGSQGARPATKALSDPFPPSATYAVAVPKRRRLTRRTRITALAVGIPAALVITVLAIAADPSPTQELPEEATTSIPAVPSPASTAPPPPPPSAIPVTEQPVVAPTDDNRNENGNNGNGNGRGQGNGPGKKPH